MAPAALSFAKITLYPTQALIGKSQVAPSLTSLSISCHLSNGDKSLQVSQQTSEIDLEVISL
jgi:hypothetical protein